MAYIKGQVARSGSHGPQKQSLDLELRGSDSGAHSLDRILFGCLQTGDPDAGGTLGASPVSSGISHRLRGKPGSGAGEKGEGRVLQG